MPDIKLPEVRLPEGLRDMRREDIQAAIPEVRMPKMDLPQLRIPKVDVDLPRLSMPAAVEERLPGRRRRNPVPLIVAAGIALGAAAWLFLASPFAPTIRRAVADARARLGLGAVPMEELDELDEELELQGPASGLETGYQAGSAYETASGTAGYEPGMADGRSPVPVGPGEEPHTTETNQPTV